MKLFNHKNGTVSMERIFPSGMYLVLCRKGSEVHDKVRCDTLEEARHYWKSFCKIVKNA